MVPFGSELPDASKTTPIPTIGLLGDNVNIATSDPPGPVPTVIDLAANPFSPALSVTVRRMSYVPVELNECCIVPLRGARTMIRVKSENVQLYETMVPSGS